MIDIHSFNTQVATDYTIEKAILLHNIYFWCKKNEANGTNIYKGKAYTYNTAEAFSAIFPYMKPRKIAETLRQMEAEGLLLSVQNKGTNRVKSYTLTDEALKYYITLRDLQPQEDQEESQEAEVRADIMQDSRQSNIQKTDVPLYKNTTMEHTEIGLCSITDINNRYKQQIEEEAQSATPTKTAKKKKEFIKPTKEEVQEYVQEKQLQFVNVDRFYNYYEKPENDWKIWRGGRHVKMTNWKLAVQNWNDREKSWKKDKGSNRVNIWQEETATANEYDQLFKELEK